MIESEIHNPKIGSDDVVAVVGLGYVGLPLAVAFGALRPTIGFDIDTARVEELRAGNDRTVETTQEDLAGARLLTFTADAEDLTVARIYIVTVPTPIDRAKRPDLRPLIAACEIVGSVLSEGDFVIFESTVYPGATEEVCVPVLEQCSGLQLNVDFYVGYSPERINPGDREHRLANIVKVTSGSTPSAAQAIDDLYGSIVKAGTHLASSIRVAEAAKVIENTQRDVNIALINELAVLFGRLGIDTHEVLEAAGTKWNFLRFVPGLVGGHCIGVDPYYLTHKAQEVGHHPEVILSGRRINDAVGGYVADQVALLLARAGHQLAGARVLILGLAFKENCPDIRNSRVVDIVNGLQAYGVQVCVFDPWVHPDDAMFNYGLQLVDSATVDESQWDAVVHAVAHDQFKTLAVAFANRGTRVVFDVKGTWPREYVSARL